MTNFLVSKVKNENLQKTGLFYHKAFHLTTYSSLSLEYTASLACEKKAA